MKLIIALLFPTLLLAALGTTDRVLQVDELVPQTADGAGPAPEPALHGRGRRVAGSLAGRRSQHGR